MACAISHRKRQSIRIAFTRGKNGREAITSVNYSKGCPFTVGRSFVFVPRESNEARQLPSWIHSLIYPVIKPHDPQSLRGESRLSFFNLAAGVGTEDEDESNGPGQFSPCRCAWKSDTTRRSFPVLIATKFLLPLFAERIPRVLTAVCFLSFLLSARDYALIGRIKCGLIFRRAAASSDVTPSKRSRSTRLLSRL